MQQLPLNLKLVQPSFSFANYIADRNDAVLQQIQAILAGRPPHLFYVWGDSGTGKTHLLHAATQWLQAHGKMALYLPMAQLLDESPDLLLHLGAVDGLCLDDIQAIAGKADWEHALFALFNQVLDLQIPLLIAANQAVAQLNFQLHDLVSRLVWGGVFQLSPLKSSAQEELLQQTAHNLGLALPAPVAQYILKHFAQHNSHELLAFLQQLDQAMLVRKQRLSIAFIQSQLKKR